MDYLAPLQNMPPTVLFALLVWSYSWKGLALWRAGRNKQRNWFIALLILNTVGLLEITYLFFFAKEKLALDDLLFWKKS